VSFSRDELPSESPRYVQDNLRLHGAEVVSLIEERNAVIYVCGDAKNMAKDVNQAFIDIFAKCKGLLFINQLFLF
jgi:methionine synthase reductase